MDDGRIRVEGRVVEYGVAVLVTGVQIGARLYAGGVVCRGRHQRKHRQPPVPADAWICGLPPLVARERIGTRGEQQADSLGIDPGVAPRVLGRRIDPGAMQGRVTAVVTRVYVRTATEQSGEYLRVGVGCRPAFEIEAHRLVQRGGAAQVARIHVSAGGQERGDHAGMEIGPGSLVQGGAAPAVPRVDVGPSGQKEVDKDGVGNGPRRVVQGRPPVHVHGGAGVRAGGDAREDGVGRGQFEEAVGAPVRAGDLGWGGSGGILGGRRGRGQ